MEFKVASNGGNCTGCSWIAADGSITSTTTEEFEKFIKTKNGGPKEIVLNSTGGSILGAMKFGEKIREMNLNTSIAKTIVLDDTPFSEKEPGICISACILSFIGGTSRFSDNNQIGIKQFYIEYNNNIIQQQLIIAKLINYTQTMGINPSFIEKTLTVKNDEIYFLNKEDIIRMKLDANEWEFEPWILQANNSKIYLESKTANDRQKANIRCGSENKVLLTILNSDLVYRNHSFKEFKSETNDLAGIRVFGIDLPKNKVKAIMSNGILGLEIELPSILQKSIIPNNIFIGMTGDIYRAVSWQFSYNLSNNNLENGLTAIFKYCKYLKK